MQQQLTVLEHLHELWFRLISSVVVAFVGAAAAYFFRAQIIGFLKQPLHQSLYYNSPMGSFQFIMQVCLLVGVILALPTLIYNLLRFIEPAFDRRFSRGLLLSVLGSSLGLATLGVLFGYYLTLPFALSFFNSVGTNALHPLITANEYFSFILGYLATFAIVFQLPLLLLFVNRIIIFKPRLLTKWRKYVYIGAFAISLIMPSSPDPISQVSLAIPIIALYEVSVVLIWKVNRKRYRRMRYEQILAAEQEQRERRAALQPAVALATDDDMMVPDDVVGAELATPLGEPPVEVTQAPSVVEDRPRPNPHVSGPHPQPVHRRDFQQPARSRPLPDRGKRRRGSGLIDDIF